MIPPKYVIGDNLLISKPVCCVDFYNAYRKPTSIVNP